MPNWVFNTVGGYSKDLMDKYGNFEDNKDPMYLDFNKVIPEPKEITNTISGYLNNDAKEYAAYKDWKESDKDKYKYSCPLYKNISNRADSLARDLGYAAIQNPDKSLNELMTESSDAGISQDYNAYVSLFGNEKFHKLTNEQFIESCDKYAVKLEKSFNNSTNNYFDKEALSPYNNIEEYGRHLIELKEKYGVDNWYDWRNNNWGVKWNGSEQEYDPESESLHFDTPWSVPFPILAKIAEDNPDKKLDIYSEEETGWFIESESKDGNLYVKAEGEIEWDEETDESKINREEVNPPKKIVFKEVVEDNKRFTDSVHSISNNL